MKSKTNLQKFSLIPFLILMVLSTSLIYGSHHNDLDLTTRLENLARVWGFLKYYHPEVAKGQIDWDQVLITAIPRVKAAGDYNSYNQEIQQLLNEAGSIDIPEFNAGTPAHPNDRLFKWMKNSHIFDSNVRKVLKTLQKKHIPADNYYCQEIQNVGSLSFDNEKRYDDTYYPDENLRLLALFRYWNIIEYFYPYKADMDQPWSETLSEFIPRMLEASDTMAYHFALRELNTRLNDSHGLFYSPIWYGYIGYYYAPFEVRHIEGQTIVTKVYSDSLDSPEDVKVGDIILRCRGENVDDFRADWRKYIEASNEPTLQRNLSSLIVKGQTNRIEYRLKRGDAVSDVTVPGYSYSEFKAIRDNADSQLTKWEILPGNIGYVNNGLVQQGEVFQVMAQLWDTKAIIFDIRRSPPSTMYWFCYVLIPTPTPFVYFTIPNLDYPGEFYATDPKTSTSQEMPDYYQGRVVILVDERTQSHAEYNTMAFQTAPDATVVGSQTAGADGNVSFVWVPGYARFTFTGLGVYYPDGSPTQRIGIVPDIEIKPTVAGIQAGKDEVLERAVTFIENGN